MTLVQSAEIQEARLLLRFAASDLTDKQRLSLTAFAMGVPQAETGRELNVTRAAVSIAQRRALKKMRLSLEALGIRRSEDICSRR